MTTLVGQQVDQYLIQHHIARGGMADVYLALDVTLQRRVALKVMLATLAQEKAAVARFRREAETVAQLHHPNIIQIYKTGVTPDNRPYLAMQYIEGGSLQDKVAQLAEQGQPMPIAESLALVRQVATALDAAHQRGIIHHDLKPSNILLYPHGPPVLTDLGIAAVHTATTHLTQAGSIVGTPHYMSPEQARGQPVDGRSDIYSLGIILYELLAGRLPFTGESPLVVLHQHIHEPPPPLALIRTGLAPITYQLVQVCLQKEPNDRFQTAAQLVAALDHTLAAEGFPTPTGIPPHPASIPPYPIAPRSQHKQPLWVYGLAAVTLLLTGFGLSQLFNQPPTVLPSSTLIPIVAGTTVTSTHTLTPTAVTHTPEVIPTASVTPSPSPTPIPSPTPDESFSPNLPATPLPAVITTDVTAVRLLTPPTIDGDLSEWPDVTPVLSAYRIYHDENWDGSDDVEAQWRLGWNSDNLYVGVSVIDDVHVQTQTGNLIYRGDSIDMQFDTDRDGDFGSGLSPDDFQITLSPGDFVELPPSAFRFQAASTGRILDAPGGNNVLVAAKKTGEGYTLEVAIPWNDLNLAPAPGLVIGLALNASDNDTPGTGVQEVMMSHVSGRTLTNPTTWGTLTLQ